MKPQNLMLLQALFVTGSIVNAGLATVTHNPVATLLAGAVMGGFQVYLQLLGNAAVPPIPPPAPGMTKTVTTSEAGDVSTKEKPAK